MGCIIPLCHRLPTGPSVSHPPTPSLSSLTYGMGGGKQRGQGDLCSPGAQLWCRAEEAHTAELGATTVTLCDMTTAICVSEVPASVAQV
jgi:hypothetical protein